MLKQIKSEFLLLVEFFYRRMNKEQQDSLRMYNYNLKTNKRR